MWGTLPISALAILKHRFIPTCVGNTGSNYSQCHLKAVHPHVCGEHYAPKHFMYLHFGSSPRVWGTRGECCMYVPWLRFIPTCVGNTQLGEHTANMMTVHPHVCGEHSPGLYTAIPVSGSSPRVWGTLSVYVLNSGIKRFIPTCVGNTLYYLYD